MTDDVAPDPAPDTPVEGSTSPQVPDFGEERSRTVTWHDPHATAAAGLTMSGLDFLRAIADGAIPPPPIAKLFGLVAVRADPGEVEFSIVPDDSSYNPLGIVHGGLACTILDTAAGCAVHTTLAAGVGYTSMEIKVNYLRPVHAGQQLTATGRVTKPGRRVAFAEAEIRDGDGKLVANATSTLLIFGA